MSTRASSVCEEPHIRPVRVSACAWHRAWSAAMTENEAAAFLAARYGLRARALTPIGAAGDASRALYRVTDAQGQRWVLRAYRADGRVAPGLGGDAAPEWMEGRAALLAALERQAYPA